MKKNNLLRIVWIVGIYAILASILYLVVLYKVKWEDKDLNTYLYFYNCSNELCTSTTKQDVNYGKLVCNDNICPYILEKNEEYLLLENNNNQFIYNYKEDKIINDKFKTYKLSSDNNYIVTDSEGNYAVISQENEELIELTSKEIIDYKNGFIIYKENGKYGIINNEKKINIKPTYEKIILIDENIYAYLEEEKYYIASYDTEVPINGNTYDYINSIGNIIIVVNNKQLDILDNNLKSKLLMKIDCHYEYRVEKEKASLNIRKKDNLILFSIYDNATKYTNYIFDMKNQKLYN